MEYTVIENEETRLEDRVIRRKIIKTDDAQYPSGYRYSPHYGYVDDRDTIPDTITRIGQQVGTNAIRLTEPK